MSKYRVTLIIESDEDPSVLLDDFEYILTEGDIDATLDRTAVEEGEAVTVEAIDAD